MCIFVIYVLLITPYEVFFEAPLTGGAAIFQDIITAFFLLDILLTFNVAIIDTANEDSIICDRYIITISYIKYSFWIDLISSLPLSYMAIATLQITNANNMNIISMLRFIRLLRLLNATKFKRLGHRLDALNINPAIITLLLLVFQMIFISHIISCFWFFLSQPIVTNEEYNSSGTQPLTWLSSIGTIIVYCIYML